MDKNEGMLLIDPKHLGAIRCALMACCDRCIADPTLVNCDTCRYNIAKIAVDEAYDKSLMQCWNCVHYKPNLKGYYRTLWELCRIDIPYATCPEHTTRPEEAEDE